MENQALIKLAANLCRSTKIGDATCADVGCALLSANGNLYTGVCVNTESSDGFCAEQVAAGAMVTAGEYEIAKVVAVWKNDKGEGYVLHPCGRCREFINSLSEANKEAVVVLDAERSISLKDLLPYKDNFAKVEL